MYFLTEDEQKYLTKGLLPKSRVLDVAPEQRGWSWAEPPMEAPYDAPLPIFQVAGKYCASGRDVWLSRAHQVRAEPNEAMVGGGLYHKVICVVLTEAKRLIYQHGPEGAAAVAAGLAIFPEDLLSGLPASTEAANRGVMAARARLIWRFEAARVVARLEDALARHRYVGADALAHLTVPLVLEQLLDGRFLGLTRHLNTDALMFSEPMVLDVKFGPREDFHRLSPTGYALVWEALWEVPVNIGCTVYVRFVRGGGGGPATPEPQADGLAAGVVSDERLLIDRDFYLIDDTLRQAFLEERDDKMRMVAEDIDPGLPALCPRDCPYFGTCHGEGAWAAEAAQDGVSQRGQGKGGPRARRSRGVEAAVAGAGSGAAGVGEGA